VAIYKSHTVDSIRNLAIEKSPHPEIFPNLYVGQIENVHFTRQEPTYNDAGEIFSHLAEMVT
jgi:hypothetical protein